MQFDPPLLLELLLELLPLPELPLLDPLPPLDPPLPPLLPAPPPSGPLLPELLPPLPLCVPLLPAGLPELLLVPLVPPELLLTCVVDVLPLLDAEAVPLLEPVGVAELPLPEAPPSGFQSKPGFDGESPQEDKPQSHATNPTPATHER